VAPPSPSSRPDTDSPHYDFLRPGGTLDRLIAAVRAEPEVDTSDLHYLAEASVHDVMRTPRVPGERCRLGKLQHLSIRSKGTVAHSYTLCKGGKCPTCVSRWIRRPISRALFIWDARPIYRAVFTDSSDWKNSQRARRLRANYPGEFIRVHIGHEGESEVFFPGEPGEGEPVDDPGTALFEALLRAPMHGYRYHGVKLPIAEHDDAAEADQPENTPKETVVFNMPMSVMRVRADEILPGHGLRANAFQQVRGLMLANKVVETTLGRAVQWERLPFRRGQHSHSWTITGLTPDEIDAVRRVLEPLRLIYLEQLRIERNRPKPGTTQLQPGDTF
jgi:hypothetical protein